MNEAVSFVFCKESASLTKICLLISFQETKSRNPNLSCWEVGTETFTVITFYKNSSGAANPFQVSLNLGRCLPEARRLPFKFSLL